MTDKAQAIKGQNPAKSIETNKATQKSKGCRRGHCLILVGMVILLLILTGFIFGGYYLKQLYQEAQIDHAELGQLQRELADSQEQGKQFQNLLELQTVQLAAVKEHLGFNQAKWQLAEAQYLLKLANFNLQYQDNSHLALQLVNGAEKLINKIQLLELQPLRNQLSDVRYQLQSIQSTDVAVLLAQLNTLQTKAINLELPTPSFIDEKNSANQADAKQKYEGWRGQFQSTLSELKEMVVVRYHEQPIDGRQLPINRSYLREQLAMLITQAEWAVMRNELHLYQTSIKQALEWVEQYFDNTKANVQAYKETLQQIQQISIAANRYPNLSPVIDDIQSILQRQGAFEKNAASPTDEKASSHTEDKE